MKTKYLLWISLILLFACNSDNSDNSNNTEQSTTSKNQNQLNITILLDLSDRVNQSLQPNQTERDIAIVSNIVDKFKSNMDTKGAFNSKDKISVLFTPTPNNANINNIAKTLSIDLSELDNKQKKACYDKIKNDFESGLREIYKMAIKSNDFPGSDIWRFFKFDAHDLCIQSDKNYRNILFIITDGYIYHEQSKDRIGNRTAFVTAPFLQSEGLRNSNWKDKFDKNNYGFITPNQTYENLDIMVLELNPSAKNKNDEDILRAYFTKWFNEMKVHSFLIYNTDLPINTKNKIDRFLATK